MHATDTQTQTQIQASLPPLTLHLIGVIVHCCTQEQKLADSVPVKQDRNVCGQKRYNKCRSNQNVKIGLVRSGYKSVDLLSEASNISAL